jgi:glycosyltransferase involved in cell wall biosynthesis
LGSGVVQLGLLSDAELVYHAIDACSSEHQLTESFGMTQAEAMIAGTPVVASDISGVREAVRVTGMGQPCPHETPAALARAIVSVLREPQRYLRLVR